MKLLYDGSVADIDTGYILMALLYFEKHFLASNVWDSVAFFCFVFFIVGLFIHSLTDLNAPWFALCLNTCVTVFFFSIINGTDAFYL